MAEYPRTNDVWNQLIEVNHNLRKEITLKNKHINNQRKKIQELSRYYEYALSKNKAWDLFFEKCTKDERKPFHQELIAQEHDLRQENIKLKKTLEAQ